MKINKMSVNKKNINIEIKARIVAAGLLILASAVSCLGASEIGENKNWNRDYDYVFNMPPILFSYKHGILSGSYVSDEGGTEVNFNDVSRFLGHVCLCGAGGFKISQIATELLGGGNKKLERGEFALISGADHTVGDVIAMVLGCARRKDAEDNAYFIDDSLKLPKREYQYLIAYHPGKTAVRIIYRKHLLMGNEAMDKLQKIELAYDKKTSSVSKSDLALYRKSMRDAVNRVLLWKHSDLIESTLIKYEEFLSRLNQLKKGS